MRHRHGSKRRGEQGSVAVEAVLLVPVAMLLLLFVLQICLWAHANTLVQEAAAEAAQTASALGGTPAAGQAQARTYLGAGAPIVGPDVSVQSDGNRVEVQISGSALSILPGIDLPVKATRWATVQQFRSNE
ncbi:MAG: TadE family protein [Acidimicrobiales bacterium]